MGFFKAHPQTTIPSPIMKSQIIKSLLIAVFVALNSPFALSEEETFKIFYGKIVSVSPDEVSITQMEGPSKGQERSFTILKNTAVVNAEDLAAVKEGMTVYLRVDSAAEVCQAINVRSE